MRSSQGEKASAKTLADSVTEQMQGRGQSGRHAFFVQLLGHAYLNLGDLDRAESLFNSAIHAAEAGHYLQIKANALVGLGRSKGQRGDLAGAAKACRGAIALLDEIGAYGDLASAHLQCALTCLPMYFSEAQAHFCNA